MKKKRISNLLQIVTVLFVVLIIGILIVNKNKEVIHSNKMLNLNFSETSINSIIDTELLLLVNGDYSIDSDYVDSVIPAFKVVALSKSNIEINDFALQAATSTALLK